MKLTINLATRRYLNYRRLNAWLIAGLLLLGALSVWQLRTVGYRLGELARIRGLEAAATAGSAALPTVGEAQLKAQAAKVRFANGIIDRKAVNWLQLLDYLEEVVPEGVALSRIEPREHDKPLQLAGVASSFAQLRALLENMERSKNFAEVYLLTQSEVKVGLTQHGINFTLACKVAGP